MERFLRYSLRWNCPIKLVYLEEGQIKSGNITVIELMEDAFVYVSSRRKTARMTLEFSDVLSAGYARGDDGDTSKKKSKENIKENNEE